jgi:iron complex outermembrane receptor protein
MGGGVGSRRAGRRPTALICGLVAFATLAANHASAQQRPRPIDIPATDASTALRELGRQTGANILFAPDVVRSLATPAIRGELSAEEAARRMLAGSGLEIVRDTTGSLLIRAGRRGPTLAGEGKPPPRPVLTPPLPPRRSFAVDDNPILPSPNELSELLVTATRLSAPVSRIPLSITALTGRSMEQQGFKTAQDIAVAIPALVISGNSTNGALVSIRGISSSQGAATTGVYLDDTPLQRRAGLGPVNGIGIVFPQIFDLERVEVLRGPQGTLYGASSEGGTVRFILPSPSTTQSSLQTRSEVSSTRDGGPSYETGVSIGHPIVEDRLGLRASLWARHTGGYVDHVSRFTGRTLAENTNTVESLAGRLALLWRVTDRLSVTPSLYYAYDLAADADSWWNPVPAVTRQTAAYDAGGQPVAIGAATATFTLPGFTYGPYGMFGAYKTGDNACVYADALASAANDQCPVRQPRKNTLAVASATVDYDLDGVKIKAISSYLEDKNRGAQFMLNNSIPTANAGLPFIYDLPYAVGSFNYATARRQVSEELRISSSDDNRPVTWVAGTFFSRSVTHSDAFLIENSNDFYVALRGVGQSVCCGGAPLFPGAPLLQSSRDQVHRETELAAFGDLTGRLTSRLSASAGVRVSRSRFSFDQVTFGPTIGYIVPTVANGGLTAGVIAESTVSPKASLAYQLDAANMIYVTAAKGFRVGGVNSAPSLGRCQGDLGALGLRSTPATFGSDSVWSYEGGAKLRSRDGRLQVNASVFRIDWKRPQTNFVLPTCGASFTINAGAARSRGFDLQSQVRLFDRLTLQASVAYTDARQLEDVVAVGSGGTIFVKAGDRLPGAPWSLHLAGQYDLRLFGQPVYLRADYNATSSYRSGRQFPAASYNPDTAITDATGILSVRGGLQLPHWELAAFVNNVANAAPRLTKNGGRTGCLTDSCETYRAYNPVQESTSFRPRTVGVSATYRR